MTARPLNIAVVGTGNRARTYVRYLLSHSEEARLVAAADPDLRRLERFAAETALDASRLFDSDERMLDCHSKDIDAVIIASPDRYHFQQAMSALKAGCHILVEKPVACSAAEVSEIASEASRRSLVAGVCHVLRYHPYFVTLHNLVSSATLGRPVAIHHRLCVGLDRALHTFVRGPWADSRLTSPPILSKCCHDADLLLWLTGATAAYGVTSVASSPALLRHDMPPDASDRCIDCHAENRCPFSAVDLYGRRQVWTDNFDPLPGETRQMTIDRYLRQTRFGRCAYTCRTDAPLSQTICMTTGKGCIATLTMDMLGENARRTTDIVLTHGEIHGDELTLAYSQLGTGKTTTLEFAPGPFHSGADHALIADFLAAIRDPSHVMRATISEAEASTRICLQAYESARSR